MHRWQFGLATFCIGGFAFSAALAGTIPARMLPSVQQAARQIEGYGNVYGFLLRCRARPDYEVMAVRVMAQGIGAGLLKSEEAEAAFKHGRDAIQETPCDDLSIRQTSGRLADFAFIAATMRRANEIMCSWSGDQATLDRRRERALAGLSESEKAGALQSGTSLGSQITQCIGLGARGPFADLRNVYRAASDAHPNVDGSAFAPNPDLAPWEQREFGPQVTTFVPDSGAAAATYVLANFKSARSEWALVAHRNSVEGRVAGVKPPINRLELVFYASDNLVKSVARYPAVHDRGTWRFPSELLSALKNPPSPYLRMETDAAGGGNYHMSGQINLDGFAQAYAWLFSDS